MEQNKPQVKWGKEELTVSINLKDPSMKTEDWHSDYDGSITINGQRYYANLYDKKGDGTWIAGRLKPAPTPSDAPPQNQQAMQQPNGGAPNDPPFTF